jgi:hypothetical protein
MDAGYDDANCHANAPYQRDPVEEQRPGKYIGMLRLSDVTLARPDDAFIFCASQLLPYMDQETRHSCQNEEVHKQGL